MEILWNLTSRPWSKFNLVTRPSSTQRAAGDVLPRSRWYLFSGSGMAMKLVKHLQVLLLYIMCIYIYMQKYCSLNVRTSRIALFSKRRAVTTSSPQWNSKLRSIESFLAALTFPKVPLPWRKFTPLALNPPTCSWRQLGAMGPKFKCLGC